MNHLPPPVRTEAEDEHAQPWFRRRAFLQAAATWTALGGATGALAQQRGNIVQVFGDVLRNGVQLALGDTVVTGDRLVTGPTGNIVFVIGSDAFRVRANTRMSVERGDTLDAVSVLRVVAGAVTSVWGRGSRREVVTPTVTAGIRGTGIFTEVLNAADGKVRSYFCNCYGTVDLAAGSDRLTSHADYHQGFWAQGDLNAGTTQPLEPAEALNHTDDELEMLAALVNQRTAWQVAGRRGVQDGMGVIDPVPGMVHPALAPRTGYTR
ncbi:MAG: iron dicitrate transport regulator FecR [Pseudomonadota bacterium]